jgi:methyl coenzyme M reductase system, component A2
MKPLITIENLTKKFTDIPVLNKISLTINEGEILGIIGRSGSGKTVLIHLLRGIDEPPTSGKIIYHIAACPSCDYVTVQSQAGNNCPRCGSLLTGKDADLWNPDHIHLKQRIFARNAIMFQRSFALYGNERVIDNVIWALDEIGYPSEKVISRAVNLIENVHLSHRMLHIARDLSGGEKQRVVLARQLAKEPFCLFADEPTGTLDPRTAFLVHKVLKESSSEPGMVKIITSHFTQIFDEVVTRAILLEDGAIKASGSPHDVITNFMNGVHDDEIFCEVKCGKPILQIRNVVKQYVSMDRGLIKAVNSVSLEIHQKEIFGIIGTSGAGKTTLSRMISGIIEPTRGELNIRIGDEWVDMTKPGYDNRGRAKQYIGLLHQEYDLFTHRNILDNLTDAIGLGFSEELAIQKAIISLRMAGFTQEKSTEILHRLPGTLSEGERHRVALAQVLIREPTIVVLDEPTGTMDPITKIDVKHSILHAREEMDDTFIVVSHDMDFVRDICDRCALMRSGMIVKIGNTAEILTEITEEERELMAREGM